MSEGELKINGVSPELSLAIGHRHSTLLVGLLGSVVLRTSSGHFMSGGWVSWTRKK